MTAALRGDAPEPVSDRAGVRAYAGEYKIVTDIMADGSRVRRAVMNPINGFVDNGYLDVEKPDTRTDVQKRFAAIGEELEDDKP